MKDKLRSSIIRQQWMFDGVWLWSAIIAAFLLASPVQAGSRPSLATADLGDILNSDGTVRAGVRGAFDAHGYTLRTTPDGRPAFRPVADKQVLGTQGAGDENWSDGFKANGADDPVSVLVMDGSGNLYAGGDFTAVGGVPANHIAKWNGIAWSALGTGIDGAVTELVIDGSGNLYAGGDFGKAGGGVANRVAKWNGTTWSALGTGANTSVYALALDANGNLYAGGHFTTIGGVAANHVAKWDGTVWSALSAGITGEVSALAVDGTGNLYAGGYFFKAGDADVRNVAKWNGTTWSGMGTLNGAALALAIDGNNNLYAGGAFDQKVAKWNGTDWLALGATSSYGTTNSVVDALTIDRDGNLYVGGYFTKAGSIIAKNIAKWNGATWSALGTGANGRVFALAVDATGNLYAGGVFGAAGGTVVNHVAKWTTNAAVWSQLGPLLSSAAGIAGNVSVLLADGSGKLYAGGSFEAAGSTIANNVAKWNGTQWVALGAGVDGEVMALALDGDGNLYVGGDFTMAGGIVANRIAKWNGTAWSALGTGVTANGASFRSEIDALVVDTSGNLYAGGYFTTAGNVAVKHIAKWNGTAWSALGTGVVSEGTYIDGQVLTLALDGSGNLYAGGRFTKAGDVAANNVAKWNGTAWSALGAGITGTESYGGIFELVIDGNSSLYVGGFFTEAGSVAANNLAKWDGTAWSALGAGGSGIGALAIDRNGNLYAAGSFNTNRGTEANTIAKWNGIAWLTLGNGTNRGGVGALALTNNGFYAGGNFTAVADGSKLMAHIGHYSFTTGLATTAARSAVNIGLFPNPAHTTVSVQVPAVPGATAATLILIDALGRTLRTQQMRLPVAGATADLPLTGLARGFYQVQVQVGSQQTTRALAVE